MREILFRGKKKDNGEWIESRSIRQFGDNEVGLLIGWVWAEIIPETLGQYTGLTDKNGNKIFEGDIVAFEDSEADFEGYHDNVFMNVGIVEYDEKSMSYYYTNRQTVEMDDLCGEDAQVIGNKWDNPELIGGNKK